MGGIGYSRGKCGPRSVPAAKRVLQLSFADMSILSRSTRLTIQERLEAGDLFAAVLNRHIFATMRS